VPGVVLLDWSKTGAFLTTAQRPSKQEDGQPAKNIKVCQQQEQQQQHQQQQGLKKLQAAAAAAGAEATGKAGAAAALGRSSSAEGTR